jgi:hypothetical protein
VAPRFKVAAVLAVLGLLLGIGLTSRVDEVEGDAEALTISLALGFRDLAQGDAHFDLTHFDLTHFDLTHQDFVTPQDMTSPFNLAVSGNGRYLTNNGSPMRLSTRALWFGTVNAGSLGEWQSVIDDTATKGYTGFILHSITTPSTDFPTLTTAPNTQAGDKPFTTCVNHSHSGNTNYDEAAAQTNYWNWLDSIIDYAATKGLVVVLYYNYLSQWGAGSANEGWGYANAEAHNTASSYAACTTYGTFIGTRYGVNRKNVLLASWGDTDDAHSNATQRSCQQAMWLAMRAATSSTIYLGETGYPDGLLSDQSTTGWGSPVTPELNSAYFDGPGDNGHPEVTGQRGWSVSGPLPLWGAEGPYSGVAGVTVQAARRSAWRATLGGMTVGVNHGVSGIWDWPVGSVVGNLNNTSDVQQSYYNAFFAAISFQNLQPVLDGPYGTNTFISTPIGAWNSDSYVVSAKSSANDLAVIYISYNGSGAQSVGVAVSQMSGTMTAKWFDPTNNSYTTIGSISNSGNHTFTTPGNNSAGQNDWALLLTVP